MRLDGASDFIGVTSPDRPQQLFVEVDERVAVLVRRGITMKVGANTWLYDPPQLQAVVGRGPLHHQLVEIHVAFCQRLIVARGGSNTHLLQHGLNVRDIGFGQDRRRSPAGVVLNDETHRYEYFLDLLLGDLCDDRSPVGDFHDESLCFKLAEGFSYGTVAGAELRCQVGFEEPLPWRYLAVGDRQPDRARHSFAAGRAPEGVKSKSRVFSDGNASHRVPTVRLKNHALTLQPEEFYRVEVSRSRGTLRAGNWIGVRKDGLAMKIRAIGVAGLRGATPKAGWTAELGPTDVMHTLVAVHTDEGITGIGSASTNDGLARAAVEVLAPYCIGDSAIEPSRVAEKLHQLTFWLGRGGALTHTISAIDIALWDILGQVTSQPVGRLLGGSYRQRVRPYASMLAEGPGPTADNISELAAAGFGAFKIGWGCIGRGSARADEEMVAAARDAAGDDALLMVDAGASDAFWPHGYKWALRTSQMLAGYGVHWFEEALPPDALDDYVALRGAAPVQIAGGEVLTRRQSYEPWLAHPAFDVVQPDVTKVGGLSEARCIGWMAEARNVKLVPHGYNTAIGLAADLQLASALPATDLVEYLVGSPYIDGIMRSPLELDADGMVAISQAPGLGIELDRDMLGKYLDPELLSPAGAVVTDYE